MITRLPVAAAEDHHNLLWPSTASWAACRADADAPRRTTETKSGVKTTELIVFVLSVLGVLIAAGVTDDGDDGQDFGAAALGCI